MPCWRLLLDCLLLDKMHSIKQPFEHIVPLLSCLAVQYEDETLQAQALSLLPDDILGAIGSEHEEEDRLARRLLAFFKNEFFTWVCICPQSSLTFARLLTTVDAGQRQP